MCACVFVHVCPCNNQCVLCYSNSRNRSSTDESLDEDEESLLEVEDVTAYLRFNKEVLCMMLNFLCCALLYNHIYIHMYIWAAQSCLKAFHWLF